MKTRPLFLLGLLSSLTALAGPACVSGDSLASYILLGAGGCDVGPVTAKDFSFAVGPFGGGAVPIAAADITVTTVFGPDYFGLKFASKGFSVKGNEFVNYAVGYTWDPSGDLSGLRDALDPGIVDIFTDGCVDAAFIGGVCGGAPVQLHVFNDGVTSKNEAFVFFPGTTVVGVLHKIGLDARGTNASFDSLENDVFVPEPSALALGALGFAALGLLRRASWPPRR